MKNETTPGLDKIFKIAMAEGIEPGWLATGEGPMRPGDHQQLDHVSEPHTRYGLAQHVPIERMPLERFKLWLDTWWDQASADERIWMKVEFERRFPEYAEFIKKMTEEPSKEQSCA